MSRGHSTAPYFSLTIINHLDDHRPGYSLRSIAVYGKGQPSESYRHLHNCAANGTITLEAEAGMRQRRRLGLVPRQVQRSEYGKFAGDLHRRYVLFRGSAKSSPRGH